MAEDPIPESAPKAEVIDLKTKAISRRFWNRVTTATLATVAGLTLLLAGISLNERHEQNETVHFMRVMQQHQSPSAVQDRQHRAFAHFEKTLGKFSESEARSSDDLGSGLEFCEELGHMAEKGDIRVSEVRDQYGQEISALGSDGSMFMENRPSFPHCANLISKLWAPEHWWNDGGLHPLKPRELDHEYASELIDSTPNIKHSPGEDIVQEAEEFVRKTDADKLKDNYDRRVEEETKTLSSPHALNHHH